MSILAKTSAAGDKPITGGSYATYWVQRGNTAGNSNQTWVTATLYEPLNFTSDLSYSTGTGAGGGVYAITANSSAINLFTSGYQPLPLDLVGIGRTGTSGAYEFPSNTGDWIIIDNRFLDLSDFKELARRQENQGGVK